MRVGATRFAQNYVADRPCSDDVTAATKTFAVIIERDPESGWLVGEAVELPGCYTQAPDLPGLEANIREAIAVYLLTKAA